jgi:hypothetical protein
MNSEPVWVGPVPKAMPDGQDAQNYMYKRSPNLLQDFCGFGVVDMSARVSVTSTQGSSLTPGPVTFCIRKGMHNMCD